MLEHDAYILVEDGGWNTKRREPSGDRMFNAKLDLSGGGVGAAIPGLLKMIGVDSKVAVEGLIPLIPATLSLVEPTAAKETVVELIELFALAGSCWVSITGPALLLLEFPLTSCASLLMPFCGVGGLVSAGIVLLVVFWPSDPIIIGVEPDV